MRHTIRKYLVNIWTVINMALGWENAIRRILQRAIGSGAFVY